MNRLYRSKKNRVLGGVLGGIAEYFSLDPVLPRIIFIVAFIFVKNLSGILILAYIASCFLLPYRSNDLPENLEGSAREVTTNTPSKKSQKIIAWSFIVIGSLSLLFYILPSSFLVLVNQYTWPILFIVMGILVIMLSLKKRP
jgi:phage shock protein C